MNDRITPCPRLSSGVPLWLASAAIALFAYGCASTKPIVKSDKYRRKMDLQSNTDPHTTLANLKKSSPLNSARKAVEKEKAKVGDDASKGKSGVKHLLNLANIYLAQGELAKAEENCRKALRFDLKNVDAKKVLASIYYRKGNFDMTAIILNGIGDQVNRDSKMQNLLGLVAFKEGRRSDALSHFQRGLKIDPSDISIRMNLGVLFLTYRQLNHASLQFERVLKLVPDHSDAKVNMAIIKGHNGNIAYAEKVFEDTLSKGENPVVLFNYAVLEKNRNNYEKSLDLLKRYLDLDSIKSSNNEEVFALIDEIQTQQRAKGDRTSDSDINKLAEKLKKKKNLVRKLDESRPANGFDKPAPAPTPAPVPAAPAKSEEELSDEDEISALERELSN